MLSTLSFNKFYIVIVFIIRLCRARRVIENAFGILAARWRVFKTEIACNPKNVVHFTKAAVVLHNYMLSINQQAYCPASFRDSVDGDGNITKEGLWRKQKGLGLTPIDPIGTHRFSFHAGAVRDKFASYFQNEGALHWQSDWVNYDGRRDSSESSESSSDSDQSDEM